MRDLNTIEQKLDLLNSIEDNSGYTESNFNVLQILSKDKDCEIRSRVAQLLSQYPTSQSETILYQMLSDEDILVRINACDSIGFSSSREVIKKLKSLSAYDKYLIRGYAVISIADISVTLSVQDEIAKWLMDRLEHERSDWVKICYYRSLYILGQKNFYRNLLSQLNNRFYQNRLLVLNMINELIDIDNKNLTLFALQNRLKTEKDKIVREKINKMIGNQTKV